MKSVIIAVVTTYQTLLGEVKELITQDELFLSGLMVSLMEYEKAICHIIDSQTYTTVKGISFTPMKKGNTNYVLITFADIRRAVNEKAFFNYVTKLQKK